VGGSLININNTQELKKIMDNIVSDALEEVTQKLLDKLIANIDEIVYIGKNEVYAHGTGVPTYQFRESWTSMQFQHGDEHKSIIYSESDKMQYDPDNYIHGDDLHGDLRDKLAAILNEGTNDSIFGQGWWTVPRPFWDATMKLMQDGTVDKWFQSALRKRGLTIKRTMSFADWSNKYSK
jgi:hypothetical protein